MNIEDSKVLQSEFKARGERIAELEVELKQWKKAVEGLTPSGSEFVNDPENCARYIRERTNWPNVVRQLRQKNTELCKELQGIANACDSHSGAQKWNIREFALEAIKKFQSELPLISNESDILVGVEFGFKEHEKGHNLQMALSEAQRVMAGK